MKVTGFKDATTRRTKWRAEFTCAKVRHRLVADSSEELYDQIDAVRRKARAVKLGLPVERRAVTLDELVSEHVRDFDLRDKNHRRAKTILEDFASRFKGKSVREVTAKDLRDYARDLKAEFRARQQLREQVRRARATTKKPYVTREILDLSPHSLNKYLNFVSAALNAAPQLFEEDLGDYRPPKVPWEPIPRRWRRRPLRQDEDDALLGWLAAPQGRAGP